MGYAVSRRAFQQQFFTGIAGLAIAAFMALPELLRPRHAPVAKREERPSRERVSGTVGPTEASPCIRSDAGADRGGLCCRAHQSSEGWRLAATVAQGVVNHCRVDVVPDQVLQR
jgi:hypothetical protein